MDRSFVGVRGKLTLLDVHHKFGLQESSDPNFFREWQIDREDLSESDQVELDRAKHDFLYLTRMPMAEDRVKMVILAPLLSLAGFFRSPFRTTSEHAVELQSEEDGILYRGRIDVLVVQDRLWVLVIESKRSTFSLQQGIPQALAYLSTDPDQDRPLFALVTNGFHCR